MVVVEVADGGVVTDAVEVADAVVLDFGVVVVLVLWVVD